MFICIYTHTHTQSLYIVGERLCVYIMFINILIYNIERYGRRTGHSSDLSHTHTHTHTHTDTPYVRVVGEEVTPQPCTVCWDRTCETVSLSCVCVCRSVCMCLCVCGGWVGGWVGGFLCTVCWDRPCESLCLSLSLSHTHTHTHKHTQLRVCVWKCELVWKCVIMCL
jgi:hypothetical protein